MTHSLSGKRSLAVRAKRTRKPASSRAAHGRAALPPPWVTALDRVKKHIQTESRHRIHGG